MRMIQLARLKAGLRRFLAEEASTEVVLNWDATESHLDIERNGKGIDITFPANALNGEGDILTDDDKQNIINTLQTIVDEHNSQI